MKKLCLLAVLSFSATMNVFAHPSSATELVPPGKGSYPVCSTSMQVTPEYAGIGDEAMHGILLGKPDGSDKPAFVTDIMAHPESIWTVTADIPESDEYGPVSGRQMTMLAYVTFPCVPDNTSERYVFPYFNGRFGQFENMLPPGAAPVFADNDTRYPLLVLAHGSQSHGIYSVGHAHDLARHGYIVAVPIYGDDRTAIANDRNRHLLFLRPLMTRALIDSIVDSPQFGPHVNAGKVGISGHSFGGFTALAAAGARIESNPESVIDSRVKAAVLAAPWVGHPEESVDIYPFGEDNKALAGVTAPMLWLYGGKDRVTQPRFILDAARKTSGSNYVIELPGQPHVFEGPSWVDRNNWELLFFNAYLKDDKNAVEALKQGSSMQGGNIDRQLFDWQN